MYSCSDATQAGDGEEPAAKVGGWPLVKSGVVGEKKNKYSTSFFVIKQCL